MFLFLGLQQTTGYGHLCSNVFLTYNKQVRIKYVHMVYFFMNDTYFTVRKWFVPVVVPVPDFCGQIVPIISRWMSAFNSIHERLIWYSGQSMELQQYNKKIPILKAKTPMWPLVQSISMMYLVAVIHWMCSVSIWLSRKCSIYQGGFIAA